MPPPTARLVELIIDNPFFVRECRQARRRLHQGAWGAGVGFAALLGVLVLFWVAPGGLKAAPLHYPLLPALCLAGGHTLLFLGGALRPVLAGELRTGTFQQLLLLPYSSGRLLLARLVYPCWWLLVTWLGGWPFYVVAALTGLAPLGLLSSVAPLPLLLALFGIAIELMDDTAFRRLKAETTSGPRPVSAGQGVGSMLPIWSLLFTAFREAVSTVPGGWNAPHPVFGGSLPRWGFWAVLLGVIWMAAAGTALAGLSTSEAAERTFGRVRRLADGLLYLLIVGSVWNLLPPWQALILLVGIPVVACLLAALIRWIVPPRRIDPLSAAEVAWCAGRWDNPLFLRDLRTDTRYVSMRRSLVRRTLVVLITLTALTLPLLAGNLGPFIPWDELVYGIGLSAAGFLFYYPQVHAELAWGRERPGHGAALLLLAPISTLELLRGRALAAVVYCWTVNAVLWLVMAAAAGWALWRGRGVPLVTLATVAPLFLAALAGSWSPPEGAERTGRKDLLILLMCGTGLGSWGLAFNTDRLPTPLMLLLAALLCAANWGLARGFYRLRLAELEQFRRDRLELLDRASPAS